MTAKKKRTTALVSLAAGICVFAGAAFANYTTSGGYSVYKKAIIGALGTENYTMEARVSMDIDGAPIAEAYTKEMYAKDGDANLYREEKSSYAGGEAGYDTSTYMQDNIQINIYKHPETGKIETSLYDSEEEKEHYDPSNYTALSGGIDMSRETDQKMVRFIELLADTFMGDLKNNFVYVSGDDQSKDYEMVLDGMQVPEFVNAGLSAMFSGMSSSEYNQDDPTLALGKDPVVRSAYTKFSVDSEGRLLHNDLQAVLAGRDENGQEHTMTMNMSIDLSGYGTTVPPKADLNSLENITYQSSRDREPIQETDVTNFVANDDGTVEIHYADGTAVVVNKETSEMIEIAGPQEAETAE